MALSLSFLLLVLLAALVFARWLATCVGDYFFSPLRALPTVHRLLLIPFYGLAGIFNMDGHHWLEQMHRPTGSRRAARLQSRVARGAWRHPSRSQNRGFAQGSALRHEITI